MPRYNSEKAATIVSQIRSSTERLKTIAKTPEDQFLRDPDKIDSAKYNFVIGIEACIDLCNHIISQNGFRSPHDYADTFKVMEETGAFDSPFTSELQKMAKFRNRLVHLYWTIDNKQLYSILQNHLGDFAKFLNSIAKFLNF